MTEWIDSLPDETPEDKMVASSRGMLDSDEAIRGIASRLTRDEAAVFLAAVNQVRLANGVGKVRMIDPSAEEKAVIKAYGELMDVRKTAEELNLSINRINYVVKKFGLKPLERRNVTFWNRPHHRQYIKEKCEEGWTLEEISLGLGQITGRKPPKVDTVRRYAEEEGVVFRQNGRFDHTKIDDLVGDVDYMHSKYNCTLPQIYKMWKQEMEKRNG